MVVASDAREGIVVEVERELYRVEEVRLHKGGGKAGAMVHLGLRNLFTGAVTERRFRPSDKLQEVELERVPAEFLYQAGDRFCFMDTRSYDQLEVPENLLSPYLRYLQPNLRVEIECLEGRPVSVLFPEAVELEVTSTGAGVHEAESTYKLAVLENGLEILVPHFIRVGDRVRVDVRSGKYLERKK
jgi:elongation factor P